MLSNFTLIVHHKAILLCKRYCYYNVCFLFNYDAGMAVTDGSLHFSWSSQVACCRVYSTFEVAQCNWPDTIVSFCFIY